MRYGRHPRQSLGPSAEPDIDSALDAMTAEELRSFVRNALERLDNEPRRELADACFHAFHEELKSALASISHGR